MPHVATRFGRTSGIATLTWALIATLPIVAGCKSIHAQSRVDPQTIAIYEKRLPKSGKSKREMPSPGHCLTKAAYDTRRGAIDLDCFYFPEDRTAKGERAGAKTAYARAVLGEGDRNRLGAVLMKQSDDICTVEMGRLVADEAGVNTALSVLTTAFATTGTLVGGETAKSVFSGLAAMTSASRDHINAQIYRNVLSTAVARAIRSERARQRAKIIRDFGRGIQAYPADLMIVDINEYHQTCSFYRGLGLVVEAVDREAGPADHDLTIRVSLSTLDASDAALRKRLKATDDADEIARTNAELNDNAARRKALLDALAAVPVREPPR